MKKGVNQWCFANGTTLERMINLTAGHGFDGIEINMQEGDDVIGLHLGSSEQRILEMGRMAADTGICIPSISTGLHWQYALSHPDAATRKKGQEVIRRMIEAAALIGADTVLVVPGAVSPTVRYDDAYERATESIWGVMGDAEAAKVHVGIENVWNKFLLSPLEMARFIDGLGSDYVGAYFDVGNVLQFSFPEQWIRILGGRIRKVHVKDFSTQVGNIHGFVPLLAGDVNWRAVREALLEIGYDGFLTAELSAYAHGDNQLIADTSRHLDVIIAD